MKEAGQRMDEMRAQYLLQHERDREEIERLNDALHDRNERTISAMRENANLSKAINNVVPFPSIGCLPCPSALHSFPLLPLSCPALPPQASCHTPLSVSDV